LSSGRAPIVPVDHDDRRHGSAPGGCRVRITSGDAEDEAERDKRERDGAPQAAAGALPKR